MEAFDPGSFSTPHGMASMSEGDALLGLVLVRRATDPGRRPLKHEDGVRGAHVINCLAAARAKVRVRLLR
jgi:hypothetical protein